VVAPAAGRRRLAEPQVVGRDGPAFRQEHRTLDGVLEVLDGLVAQAVAQFGVGDCESDPLSLCQLERLGGSTINVPSDVTLGQLAEMRAATSVPIDLYVETPDALGGVVRGHETADLVSVAAPMYVKFGLRNSRLLYPSGLHLVDQAAAIAREKIHRASVALEWMRRSGRELVQSAPGAEGLGVPEP